MFGSWEENTGRASCLPILRVLAAMVALQLAFRELVDAACVETFWTAKRHTRPWAVRDRSCLPLAVLMRCSGSIPGRLVPGSDAARAAFCGASQALPILFVLKPSSNDLNETTNIELLGIIASDRCWKTYCIWM